MAAANDERRRGAIWDQTDDNDDDDDDDDDFNIILPQIKNNRLVRKDSQKRKQIETTLKAVSTNIDAQNGLNSKLAFHEIAQNPYSHSYKVKILKEKITFENFAHPLAF